MMRRFYGVRPNPPQEYVDKGITNSGENNAPDYEGIVFSDGTVVIRWMTTYQSHSIWPDYETFYHVHGHPEYGTAIVWLDPKSAEIDPEVDAAYIRTGTGDINRTVALNEHVNIDVSANGTIIGIELLNVRDLIRESDARDTR